jgi:ABC-type Fe3+/spermidine/putrescine transport system ATPase subunit
MLDDSVAAPGGLAVEEVPSLLELRAVTKHYGGVVAVQDVNFSCRSGAIHAVIGENGAGKSTLIKIIAGVLRPDSSRIILDGQHVVFASPADAMTRGVVAIYQELSLVPDLSVAANLNLTHRPSGALGLHQSRRTASPCARRSKPHRLRRHASHAIGERPFVGTPPACGDRQSFRPQSSTPHPRRGDVRARCTILFDTCGRADWPSSSFRTGCMRSPISRTYVRSFATGVTLLPFKTAPSATTKSSDR